MQNAHVFLPFFAATISRRREKIERRQGRFRHADASRGASRLRARRTGAPRPRHGAGSEEPVGPNRGARHQALAREPPGPSGRRVSAPSSCRPLLTPPGRDVPATLAVDPLEGGSRPGAAAAIAAHHRERAMRAAPALSRAATMLAQRARPNKERIAHARRILCIRRVRLHIRSSACPQFCPHGVRARPIDLAPSGG